MLNRAACFEVKWRATVLYFTLVQVSLLYTYITLVTTFYNIHSHIDNDNYN